MTDHQKQAFMASLNQLDKRYDRYWTLLNRAEASGDTEKANRCQAKIDCISAEMDGMLSALQIFGHTFVPRPGGQSEII